MNADAATSADDGRQGRTRVSARTTMHAGLSRYRHNVACLSILSLSGMQATDAGARAPEYHDWILTTRAQYEAGELSDGERFRPVLPPAPQAGADLEYAATSARPPRSAWQRPRAHHLDGHSVEDTSWLNQSAPRDRRTAATTDR